MSKSEYINGRKTVIFIHIPRAAGTSLLATLRRLYEPDSIFIVDNKTPHKSIEEFKRLPNVHKAKVEVIEGHWPVGLHEFISNPYTYITLLRDPVDRVISLYYHILQRPDHYAHNTVVSKNMSLKDFVLSGVVKEEANNGQTWLLSGGGLLSEKSLELAKKNLQVHFAVAGVTKMFDETLVLLKHTLGWKRIPFYYRRHVGPNWVPKERISPEVLDVIKDYNQLDIELYKYVLDRFKERIEQEGISFQAELKWFKLLNFYYNIFVKIRSFAGFKINKAIALA